MKRDYSIFVQLPQKTSIHISTPANILKNCMHVLCVKIKSIKYYISVLVAEQNLVSNLIEYKYRMFCDYHSIFKYC
mgnify:CR=1 FL=1